MSISGSPIKSFRTLRKASDHGCSLGAPPYVRMPHQIANFVWFCETIVKAATVQRITLVTSYDQQTDMAGLKEKLDELKESLSDCDVALDVRL